MQRIGAFTMDTVREVGGDHRQQGERHTINEHLHLTVEAFFEAKLKEPKIVELLNH